jgi:hypothetical protein
MLSEIFPTSALRLPEIREGGPYDVELKYFCRYIDVSP